MQYYRAKIWLVVLAGFLSLASLLFYPAILLYSMPLLLAAFFYEKSRLAFWSSIILAIPFVLGAALQLTVRLYFLLVHGGEAPDGTGSPAGFLIGFALESPFYIVLGGLLIAWVRDIREHRAAPAEDETAAEDQHG